MNKIMLLVLCIITFVSGIIVYSFKKKYIVIQFPSHNVHPLSFCKESIYKKDVIIYYWSQEKWLQEKCSLLWSNNRHYNCKQIIQWLLDFLHEEKIISKKTVLQSALSPSDNNELYLSFDRNFLDKQASIYNKLFIIKSLFKTLQENNCAYTHIHIFVNHQPLCDPHLNFCDAWPLNGFTA